jgi:hypothetical protein
MSTAQQERHQVGSAALRRLPAGVSAEVVRACYRLRCGRADARDAQIVRNATLDQLGRAWAATGQTWYHVVTPETRRSA